jgi:putative Mg2+ transporter-C (MgtC) family protein
VTELPLLEDWARLGAVLPVFLVRCGAAALCGALVGLERERRGKPAGFRTNILICFGSSVYMVVGLLIVDAGAPGSVDATRVAAQVVTGIGFLGAGAIIQSGGRVRGLTTAATIWVVAAIGLVAGAGFPILAFIASAMVLVTLQLLGVLEKRFIEPDDAEDQ